MDRVTALVVSVAGSLTVLVYCRFLLKRQRRTLQWFYARQSRDLSQQSEIVREQLFQKAFALKRLIAIGILSSSVDASEQLTQCLPLAEDFNSALEQVSNVLSAPFLEDSVPLALQYLTKCWVNEDPSIQLELRLPSVWLPQSPDKHRLLLWCVHECLTAWQSQLKPMQQKTLTMHLNKVNGVSKLQMSFEGQVSNGLNRSFSMQMLKSVRQVFNLLMPGRCRISIRGAALNCEFSWSGNSAGSRTIEIGSKDNEE